MLIFDTKTLFFIVIQCMQLHCNAKTVRGVFSTQVANANFGQYVSSFCFHDASAILQYTVNHTGQGSPKLLFYLEETWKEAKDQTDCQQKLGNAKFGYNLASTSGNQTVSHFNNPRTWHILYVDDYTCSSAQSLEEGNFIQYEMQLLNPDALGNPTSHFSDEETGLLTFYQLLTLLYFVMACICAPKLHQTLNKKGPMHLVIQLLTSAMTLQAMGAFSMAVHYHTYSKDGIGSPFCELISEFLDVLSQFIMLYLLLSLALGWTLGGAHKPSHFDTLKKRPAGQVVGLLGVLQGVLFLWEQYQEKEHRMYHAHRSIAGTVLVLLRILLAALFASHLYSTLAVERSSLKRQFYSSFTKSCVLWFLCYPVLVITSWVFNEYLRYKVVTMGVVFCQSVAVIFLYRLFLSRSLYWEVSALSSSLPLRMDKHFNMKLYS